MCFPEQKRLSLPSKLVHRLPGSLLLVPSGKPPSLPEAALPPYSLRSEVPCTPHCNYLPTLASSPQPELLGAEPCHF